MKCKNLPGSGDRLTIGLVTSQIHTHVFEDQWLGVFTAAKKLNVNLLIYPGSALKSPYGFQEQGNLLYEAVVQPTFFDGLILWSGALDWFVTKDEFISFAARFAQVPLVSMETPLPGVPTINIGNYQGMWDVVQHLLVVHGFRRIAFVKGPEGHHGVHRRYEAYCDCLAAHDVPFDPALVVDGDFLRESGNKAVSMLLDERQVEFDAVVAANDMMALGVVSELQARGFVVPLHKAVASFDADQVSSPPLTTAYPPFYEMGYLALETCVSMINGHEVPHNVEMPAELIVRRSCGCLPHTLESYADIRSDLQAHPESISQQMKTAVLQSLPNSPAEDVLDGLCQAFEQSLLENRSDVFISRFDEVLLLDVTRRQDLEHWHEVISIFRTACDACAPCAKYQDMAESLIHQARVLIVNTQRWTYEYRIVEAEEKARTLHNIGDSLITAFGLNELKALIVNMFPEIGVRQCAVALYRAEEGVPTQGDLLVAYDENGRRDVSSLPAWDFSECVLPLMLQKRDQAQTYIVAPLHFREESLGVVIFGIGVKDGTVYETLRTQLNSALKRSLMVTDIQKAQNELEMRVAERTSELLQEVAQHKQTTQALQKSEATTRALLEAIPDAIFLVDEEARFLNFMPMEGLKTAVNVDDYLGLTLNDVLPPELAQKFLVAIPDAADTESMLLQEYMVEIGDESRFYEARLISVGQGNVLGILRDITDRKQNETVREQLIVELEAKNAELERFTYTVSHDLKSPLVTIQGFIGFLETDIAEQNWESVTGDMNHIKQATEKMRALLQDLLELSRLGRIVNSLEAIPFTELVRDATDNLAYQFEERGIDVIVPEHMPTVSVDRLRMIEVLQNLLENAVKFMGDQPLPKIEIGFFQGRKETTFFVKDNGVGLDSKYHEKAFDLFERMHLEVEGTGVGLALVKRIVELHKGRVWVESPGVGQGSTFFFTLPIAAPLN